METRQETSFGLLTYTHVHFFKSTLNNHLHLQCHKCVLWLRFDTIVVNLELNSLAFVGILSLPFLPCLHKVKEVPTYETFYGMNSWNIWGSASAFWLPSSSCHPRWFGFWKGCLDTFGLWSQSRTYLYFSSWISADVKIADKFQLMWK